MPHCTPSHLLVHTQTSVRNQQSCFLCSDEQRSSVTSTGFAGPAEGLDTPTIRFLAGNRTPTIQPSAFNPLNAEFNPICHLLALLGAHHILHISRIRVNLTGKNEAVIPIDL